MHVYSVNRAIDRVLPGLQYEQKHTVDMMFRENPYFQMICWAQRQATAQPALFDPQPDQQ